MDISQKKSGELEQRTIDFSVATVKFCGRLTSDKTLSPLASQLIRSATSIGANYAEANNASSRTDFKNKVYIAKKEAGETRYWLKLLAELYSGEELESLQQEALELNLILQKIISTIKNGHSLENDK